MEFIAGLIGKETGQRYIISGRAVPAVNSMVVLSDGSVETYDWGRSADLADCIRLAHLLLEQVGHASDEACFAYSVEVVREKMVSGSMWFLNKLDIAKWLEEWNRRHAPTA